MIEDKDAKRALINTLHMLPKITIINIFHNFKKGEESINIEHHG